ncbi:hypothetical protein BDZ45DRAFT_765417 [Acephala macrosclerotiorum]|nr:hypothetical protein BDZ45DRAFT_765417 [Acephala macrosclerotiorum]
MYLLQAVFLSLLAPFCLGWTFSTGVDLAWPPLTNEGYITIDSKVIGDDGSLFPCSNEGLTGKEPRVIFPVTGGQLQWNLTNSTGELSDYYFVINIHLAQITADTSEFHNQTACVDNEVWKNFTTREECGGESINATSMINKALKTNYNDVDVVGMNATFGLRFVLFSSNLFYPYPLGVATVAEMYQAGDCSLDSSRSYANPQSHHSRQNAGNFNFVSSSTAASSSGTTAASTPIALLEGTTENHQTQASTIGIGVGVSVGVSSIFSSSGSCSSVVVVGMVALSLSTSGLTGSPSETTLRRGSRKGKVLRLVASRSIRNQFLPTQVQIKQDRSWRKVWW